jgi:hypothetical protein
MFFYIKKRLSLEFLCCLSIILSLWLNSVNATEILSTPIYFNENDIENGKIFSIKQNNTNGIDVYYVHKYYDKSTYAEAECEGYFNHFIDKDETDFLIYFPQQINIDASRKLGDNYTKIEEKYHVFDNNDNELFFSDDTTQKPLLINDPEKYTLKTRCEIWGEFCLLGCKLITKITASYKSPKVTKHTLGTSIYEHPEVQLLNELSSTDISLMPDFSGQSNETYSDYAFWHEKEHDNSVIFYRYDTNRKTIDYSYQENIRINNETFLIDFIDSQLILIWLQEKDVDDIGVMHTKFDVDTMVWTPHIKDLVPTNTKTPIWEWDSLCSENGMDTYRYWLDDNDVISPKPGNQYTPSQLLSDGDHTLCVQEQCRALTNGWEWSSPQCFMKTIDTVEPFSHVDSPEYIGGKVTNISISYAYSDNSATTTKSGINMVQLWHKRPQDNIYSLYSVDYSPDIDNYFEYTLTTEGQYYFYSKAYDNAGNVETKYSHDTQTYYSMEKIITVPDDIETIQDALNSAKKGYTILVLPGRYIENIVWPNVDGISLTGKPDMTSIIDGNKIGSVIRFEELSVPVITEKTTIKYFQIVNGESLGEPGEPVSGGGLYINNASPSLSDLIISDNSANYGGGVYMKKSNSKLSKLIITNNRTVTTYTSGHGGGIYMSDCASPSITNITICNNISSLYGGGIACNKSSPFLSDIFLKNNLAESGGGMHFTYLSKPNLLNITLTKNHSRLYGGAIYIDKNQTPTLSNLNIWENTANKRGGGIYSRANINFSDTQLCNIYYNYAPIACDLYSEIPINFTLNDFTVKTPDNYFLYPIENFTLDIKNAKTSQVDYDLYVSLHGNDSNDGASSATPLKRIIQALSMINTDANNMRTIHIDEGVYDLDQTEQIFPLPLKSFLTLEGAGKDKTFLDASQTSRLISIIDKQNIIIKNLSIINGSETRGGGIFIEGSQDIKIINAEIKNNMAEVFGGGIYFNDNDNIEINDLVFSNNETNNQGGGIYISGSGCLAKKLNITNNYAKDGAGMCLSGSNLLLENSLISENKASLSNTSPGKGGGIYSMSSDLTVSKSIISKNSAFYGGGFLDGNSMLRVSDVVITENVGEGLYLNATKAFLDHIEISSNHGDGIYCTNSSPLLTNMTIVNNYHQYTGRGLYAMRGSHPIIKNSIFWNNQTPQIFLWDEYGQNSVDISYSVVQEGRNGIVGAVVQWAESNVVNDPLLLTEEENINHLHSNSPCIDAGTPDLDEDGILWTDDIDDQDPDGTRIDIGAYYFPIFTLHLKVPGNILENEGLLIKRGEVFIKNILDYDLHIQLTSDYEGLVLPESITILSGDQSAFFDIEVIDNDTTNQSKYVTVNAMANDWEAAEETIIISDNEIIFNISNPKDASKVDLLQSITGNLNDTWEEISAIELQVRDGVYFLNDQYHFVKNESWLQIDKKSSWEFDTKNVVWSDKTAYTITALAIEKTGFSHLSTVSFTFQSDPDPISSTMILSHIREVYTVGDSIPFTLIVIPKTTEQVDLTAPVNIDIISPDDNEISMSNYNMNKNGQLQGKIQCSLLDSAGQWMIKASWSGKPPVDEEPGIAGSVSIPQAFTILKAQTTISLNAPSHNIQKEEPVIIKSGHAFSMGGKITTEPFCDLSSLSNLPISICVYQSTSGQPVAITTVYTKESGQFLIQNFKNMKEIMDYQVVASFVGNSSFAASKSYTLYVRIVPSAGYAILATGRIENNEGLESHQRTMSAVHTTLTERGVMENDINYIDSEQNSLQAMEESITQWALEKMNESSGNLYLVLINHGQPDKFFVSPNEILTPELLNNWLNTLEESLNDKSLNIVIVLGFCQSGSFIPKLSKNGRIVITSSGPDEYSYKGSAKDIDAVRDGEFFVSEFFKEVMLGKPIRDCFNEATKRTENYTMIDSVTAKMLEAPYFDNALQHPLLDDNGDGKGSNELIDLTRDGKLSSQVIIGVNNSIYNAPDFIEISEVTPPIFLRSNESSTSDIWAKVNKEIPVSLIWIEIKKPETSFKPDVIGQREMELIYVATDEINQDQNRYEWPEINCFQTPGTYQIFYYAIDDDKISTMKESRVYKGTSQNKPPSIFQLISPKENEDIDLTYIENEKKYVTLLDWQDSIDNDDDNVTYTVYISDNPSFTGSNTIIKQNLQDSSILIPIPFGEKARYPVYWNVLAIDTYGGVFTPANPQIFYANFVGPDKRLKSLSGKIYSAITNRPIRYSSIVIENLNNINELHEYDTDSSGRYNIILPASGFFKIYISAKNHVAFTEPFEFPANIDEVINDYKLNLLGDINLDNKIDLKDVISTMKSISKMQN